MSQSSPNWELYERMVARLISDQISTGLCVTPNARIIGEISGRSRQIDVVIDSRHDTDNARRIIVDAKRRRRKVDVTDVEAFRGMMEDVGATHGYLVCPSGHTKAAERRAQTAVSICLVPLDHLQNFDPSAWPKCANSRCGHGRVFWDGYPEVLATLQAVSAVDREDPGQIRFLHYVGKCDRCGRFHVKCVTCDDILSPIETDANDTGHQCSCKPPWFWLASIEQDEHGRKSAELHVVLPPDTVITTDRRPL